MLTPRAIAVLLRNQGWHLHKRWGQNFLIDRGVRDQLVRSMAVDADTSIVEIGPGLGVLTEELAGVARRCWAIERDPRFAAWLGGTLADRRGLHIVCADVLDVNLEACARVADGPVHVIGNLPYATSSPIVAWCMAGARYVQQAVFTLQAEVADRLMARPGSKAYSSLTCLVQRWAEIELVCRIHPRCFFPSPQVQSAAVRVSIRATPQVMPCDEAVYRWTVRSAFGQRRKTLLRAMLGQAPNGWSRERIIEALQQANIDGQRRGETLDVTEFARVADALSQLGCGMPG